MGLTQDERDAIVKIRLQQAKETLEEAYVQIENKLWRVAANRLYYACFYAGMALMVKNEFQVKTHSGLIAMFGLHFVQTGKVSDNVATTLGNLFQLRQKGDYDVWVDVDEETILPLVEPVKKFLDTIEKLIFAKKD
jgi:uncharacterized protein (UPF0332 family)